MSLCSQPCCGGSIDDDDGFLHLPQNIEIPVKKRKQTDIPCFIFLNVFVIFLMISVLVASGQGDIRRLTHGYDEKGNICGVKNEPIDGIIGSGLDLREQKYLLIRKFCRYYDQCWTEKHCVKECKDGYDTSIIPRCISDTDEAKLNTLKPFFEMAISDLSLCWREIIVLCLLTIFLSGVILTILPMYAKIVIKIIFLIVSMAAIGATILTWTMYGKTVSVTTTNYTEAQRKMWLNERLYWFIAANIVTVFSVLFFVMLYVLRHKLKLVSVLFEEGGKCIKDIPVMLMQPILTHLINAVFTCLMVFGFFCLITSGTAEMDSEGRVSFPINIFFQITTWLLLFGFLWVSQFFLACQNLVIAGAVSSWYFSRIKGQLIFPVWKSLCMIIKYHLGSAAFGSLLIAIIKAFRCIARMIQRRDGRNPLAFIIWGIIQCLLACIEAFLKIISKTAYVMIVLLGDPFCASARRAYTCITSDSSKVALLIGAETFILAVIELLITFVVTIVGEALMTNIKGVQIFWVPSCVVFLLSYLCCHVFFSVYNMTIDTLILCFCVDHQMNNGYEKPYYMNENLKVLFNEDDPNVIAPLGNGNDTNILIVDLKK